MRNGGGGEGGGSGGKKVLRKHRTLSLCPEDAKR